MSENKDYILEVSVADRKYTVVQYADGRVCALRNGNSWRDCVGDNLVLALAQELHDAREQRDGCEKVPGVWVCPKCGFELTLNILHTKSATMSHDITVADRACPNDGELMIQQTWKMRCESISKVCETQLKRAVEAEDLLKEALNEIEPYYIDWALLNSSSPDHDPNYRPEFPEFVKKIRNLLHKK